MMTTVSLWHLSMKKAFLVYEKGSSVTSFWQLTLLKQLFLLFLNKGKIFLDLNPKFLTKVVFEFHLNQGDYLLSFSYAPISCG